MQYIFLKIVSLTFKLLKINLDSENNSCFTGEGGGGVSPIDTHPMYGNFG